MTRTASELQEELTAAEPQPKAKSFNAEERSKQRKDEESQKINHGGTETQRGRAAIKTESQVAKIAIIAKIAGIENQE